MSGEGVRVGEGGVGGSPPAHREGLAQSAAPREGRGLESRGDLERRGGLVPGQGRGLERNGVGFEAMAVKECPSPDPELATGERIEEWRLSSPSSDTGTASRDS